ncbi:MAG: ATP-binding protein, partial [Flavobacterium sp.]
MNESSIIKALLKQDEDTRFEKLLLANFVSISQTICAFLNTEGGQILIGASDKVATGIENADEKILRLRDFLGEAITPSAIISIWKEFVEDTEFIMVETLEGANKPYVFDGTIYVRQNNKNRRANRG